MSDDPIDMDALRAEFEAWHAEHYIEPLTRSPGGSDYRNNTVAIRWEAWQGARGVK